MIDCRLMANFVRSSSLFVTQFNRSLTGFGLFDVLHGDEEIMGLNKDLLKIEGGNEICRFLFSEERNCGGGGGGS